jgi:hypothetical protein
MIIISTGFLAAQMVYAFEPKQHNTSSIADAPELIRVSTNPSSNIHNAPRTTTVSILYNQEMDVSTVSTQTFAIYGMQTGLLTETFTVNGGEILLTPNTPFWPGELVQASATTGTLNITGTNPLTPTVWQFRTAVDSYSGAFVTGGQNIGNKVSLGVKLGDLDNDGDLDAFVANNGANTVWFNDGTGSFTDTGQTLGNGSSAIDMGDLDGDGDLDVFAVNFSSADKVWLNDSTGNFTDSGQNLNHGFGDSVTVALGDVDGDGDLDAYVGDYNSEDSLWLNDGQGNFTDSGQSLRSSRNNVSKLGDLDGDGDLDLFFITDYGTNDWVWFNDGAGNFSSSGQTFTASGSWGLALGDVDNDGDLDAFVGSRVGANTVWLNNGSGIFTNSGQSLGNSVTYYGVGLGDLDGDGNLDAFVANNGQNNKIWLNNGSGIFTETQTITDSAASFAVDLGDIDNDGDLDAFVANGGFSSNQPNTVWLWEQDPRPEIDVQGNGQSIPNGSATSSTANGTDFGLISDSITHTFTISNSGLGNLILDGSPAVSLTSGTVFSVTVQPITPVISNTTTTFEITFSPSAIGTFTDTVQIRNNDQDENPYTFVISGKGATLTFLPLVMKE